MKKMLLVLWLLFATGKVLAQCSSCSAVIPLIDNDFSQWNGNDDVHTYHCSDLLPGWSIPTVNAIYFDNAYLPNWYRINGTPEISGAYPSPPYNINLHTTAASGGGTWCGAYSSQGIAANYPFLLNGQYQVSINFSSWENDCTIGGNASVSVYATNGLTETSDPPSYPSNFVEPPVLGAAASMIGNWPVPSSTSALSETQTFCEPTPMNQNNLNQIYIFVNQTYEEIYASGDYVGEEMGFGAQISSVDVKICNACPADLFTITSPQTVDEDASLPMPFILGGLFVHSAIVIEGKAFTNDPGTNTLLWAKYITVDKLGSVGDAFKATVNNGFFFEMLPNPNCGPVLPCSIFGPSCVLVGSTIDLTSGFPGGVWSSSDPSVATVNSSTGVLKGLSSSGAGVIVDITYTVGDCSQTIPIVVSKVSCSDNRVKAPVRPDTSSNISPIQIHTTKELLNYNVSIHPNPTQDNITITYSCYSSGLLEIGIEDVTGRIMYTQSVSCNDGGNLEQVVDMSTFTPGVYFVNLTLNEQHVVKKVVKL